MKLPRSAVMQFIRKSTLKTNGMGRFENYVLLDFAFSHTQTSKLESFFGKDNILSRLFFFVYACESVLICCQVVFFLIKRVETAATLL